MAVFCNKCGKDLLEQSRFCPFCGVVSKRTVDGSIAFQEPDEGPYCPACGKRTVEKSKHCMWCGLDVHARPEGAGALICPKCVEKNPEDAGFCSQCRMDFGQWFAESGDTGKLLAGRYRLENELGRGGMGVVYKAYDTKMEMAVAVKMVPPELARNQNAVATLKKEARIAIKLTHPNITRLFTFEEAGKEVFLVMEYIEGKSLEDVIQKRGKLEEGHIVELGCEILKGLEEAHKRGVIHRDLKPANIIVSSQGEVKILDFGIARVLKETMTRFSQQAVSSSGTLLYMPPEQIKGKQESPQSDLYSFGAMIYELLSGNPPFFRGALEHQILNEAPEPLKGVSPWLNEVVLRCLSKDPVERYSTANELANALTTGGKTRRAPPKKPARPAPAARELPSGPAGKPKKWIVWAAAAAVVVIAGIALGWYLGFQMPRAKDEEACEKARKADSKKGWQAYLGENPQGMCADQARDGVAAIERRADEAACKKAKDADTEAGWKAYLGERPEGACKEEAKKRLEQIASAERERLAKIEAEKKAAEEEKARKERIAKIKDVKQPGTNLYWLRCPIGQRWTGSSCKGKAREMNWHKAKNACPDGYWLPTRQEFVSLLGGCDADVKGGKGGSCNKCAKSRKCRSMFGKDERHYWSSSSDAADSPYVWNVRFNSGDVDCGDKDNDFGVRCVRSGP